MPAPEPRLRDVVVTLRPGTPDDAAVVADIWFAGWHPAHAGHVPDGLTERRTLAAFRERAPHRVAHTTVAEVDGELAGFIMVVGDEVEQVYVAPAHQGRGVAGVLLDEAERQVAAGGHRVAWLAVVTGNRRARAFYEKQGWVDDGDLPYEVEALGERFVSPCRRYVKPVL
jgi:GNAT superfamily N-acetyltransferase